MATATPNSVIVYIDDERIELTGKDAIDFEATRTENHQNYLDQQAKKAKDATAKAALLTKLGITAEEAALLLGGN
jgi:hypothetical protein